MPTNRNYRFICAFVCIALVSFPGIADASWLSDITGVNIDIPRGQVTFGPPRPDRIPLMLQNLPKDATQFFFESRRRRSGSRDPASQGTCAKRLSSST